MSSASTWGGSDGWLLTALAGAPFNARSKDDLSGFVADADMLNHAIVTYDELCDVLTRLAASGIVTCDGDLIMVAPAVKDALSAIIRGSQNAMFAPDNVFAALRTGALKAEPAPSVTLVLPTAEEFEAAVAAYTGDAPP